MNPITPYLFFNGNCREAMNFYKECFGGDLELITYAQSPEKSFGKEVDENGIMHAFLKNGSFIIMASDSPDGVIKEANNVHLNIDCASMTEIETLFKKISQGGTVVQALTDTFWGAHFGMAIDKFGIHWMLNYHLKK